jgi:hypothetical protein
MPVCNAQNLVLIFQQKIYVYNGETSICVSKLTVCPRFLAQYMHVFPSVRFPSDSVHMKKISTRVRCKILTHT